MNLTWTVEGRGFVEMLFCEFCYFKYSQYVSYCAFLLQLLYHRGWFKAVEAAKSGLNASLLVRHPETKVYFFPF